MRRKANWERVEEASVEHVALTWACEDGWKVKKQQ